MNIFLAILIFTIIIVVHELGHFLLAKKNGVAVTEFSVGMGPRLITLAKGENGFVCRTFLSQNAFEALEGCENVTKYSWKILPIGGSCMMLGEDETVEDDRAFNKKGVFARISVIFGGPAFNFILAFVLAIIIISIAGHDVAMVGSLEPGYPMAEAGIQTGDEILSINGKKISISREVGMFFQLTPMNGEPVNMEFLRDGEKYTASITPILNEEGKYKLGFGYNNGSIREKTTPLETIKYAVVEVKFWIELTIKSLGQLITGKVGMDQMAGPVGIVNMVGDVIEESSSYGLQVIILNILNWCILLSANLGVMNLLPIPALDGGRLVFLFLEAIRRKPIDKEKEGMVHLVGMVALMLLMVFVMYNDISRLF